MINKYIYDTKTNTLGFTFWLFDNQQFVIDHDTYKDSIDMKYYFQGSKSDILGINIETYIIYCKKYITSTTVLIDESIEKLKKLTHWRIKHK